MKTVDWSKLPIEILRNIFQRNDDITNSRCSLTCRDWKYTARCILFEKIPIMNGEKLDVMSKALSIYQSNCTDFDQSPGNYVKIVNGRSLSHSVYWKQLDRLFPFLEVIETDPYMNSAHNKIYRLLKEGKFPHLKVFPTGHHNKPPLQLLIDRREKIEELILYSISREDKILQNLELLPNLKKLDLRYRQDVHFEQFFSKDMLNLKSINIMFGRYSWKFYTSLLNMDDIQSFPNIREMEILYCEFSYYDDKYFLYIMKKFPNLETLQLRNGYCNGNDYTFSTIDCLFQFLVYLTKMRRYSYAGHILISKFTTQLVKKFLNYIIDQCTVYCKNTNISLQIDFNFIEPEQEHNNPPDLPEYIAIENQKAGYDGYKEDKCILSVIYDAMEGTTIQSHLQLFREVGNINITCLKIKGYFEIPYRGFSIINLNIFRSIIPVELDMIFSYFSKLEHLEIIEASNFIWSKEEYLVEETLKSTIKYMLYRSCILSKDIFPIISKRCQNLKFLKLENCWYTNKNEDQVVSRYFPIFIKSTCLEELTIHLNNAEEFQYKKGFVRLITNNRKPRYCKITTETGFPIVNFSKQDCTEAHYNICLHDEEYGIFDIHCESVVKLTIQFQTDDCGLIERSLSDKEDEDELEEEECVYWKKREYLEEDL